MNKQDLLYDIFLKEKTLSSKQITCLGFARIYITMLEKENKIFKVARGIYSIDKNISIDPFFEFQKSNKKIIYSCFSSLYLQKEYSYYPKNIQISVPQGYNATRYTNCDVFYNNLDNYGVGKTSIELNGNKIYLYDLERSICDIIKDENRFDKREYNKLINYYFNKDNINYQKLLEYSKLLKVSKKVQQYLSLFKA